MKLYLLFLLASIVQVKAATIAQTVSLSCDRMPLKTVFEIIESQTGYTVFSKEDLLKHAVPVTLKVNNLPLTKALDKIFTNQPMDYSITDKIISISPSRWEKVQKVIVENKPVLIQLEGFVKDDQGKPIVGASVYNALKKMGITTDVRGYFRVTGLIYGDIIEVTAIGYAPLIIRIGKDKVELEKESSSRLVNRVFNNILIQLEPTISDLQDVVIVGYGTVSKSDLTGAVTSVKPENIEKVPITSPDQILQGKVAGLRMVQQSGAPGAGINIEIRGGNSISGSNQPLFVIDGYPVETETVQLSGGESVLDQQPPPNPLANINPNDIESIEVLKDASATAIFGSRGANGVIIITTKMGTGEKVSIDYNSRLDISRVINTIDVLRPYEFGEFVNASLALGGQSLRYTEDQLEALKLKNTNWQKEIYRSALTQDHQMAVRGSDKNSRFSISGNYLSQEGIIKNTSMKRGTGRLNYERNVSDKITIGGKFSFSKSVNQQQTHSQRSGTVGNNVILSALIFDPTGDVYAGQEEDDGLDISLRDNPVIQTSLVQDILEQSYFVGALNGIVKLTKNLDFRTTFGVNENVGSRSSYQPRGTFTGNNYGGMAFRGETNRFNSLVENTLNYNKLFNKKHRTNVVLGQTWQKWVAKTIGIRTGNFLNDELSYNNISMGLSPQTPDGLKTYAALSSYLGRINYTFNNRYLFTLTGRADGSSRLSRNNRWDLFPSMAVGWRLDQEDFIKGIEEVSNLKLKLSWGTSGNQSIGIGRVQSSYGINRYPFGGTLTMGVVPARLGNEGLDWERTSQMNTGLELGLFNNRVTFNIDYYVKQTTGLLFEIPIATSSGFSSYPINAGDVRNRGLEVSFDAKIMNNTFKWNISGNYSMNRNEVKSLDNLESFYGPNYISSGGITLNQPLHIAVPGSPIGSFWGYKTNGLYQNFSDVAIGPESATASPGDIRYVDINGDNKIDANDLTIIGDSYPDFIVGLTNNLVWKSFSMNFMLLANAGGQIANLNRYILDGNSLTESRNISQEAWTHRWQGEGTSNYYPRLKPSTNSVLFNQRFSDFFLEDASFIRLKYITLNYDIALKKANWIKKLQCYLSATNILTLSKYKGYDPDISSGGAGPLTQGVDLGTYPLSRTISLGLGISF